MGSTFYQMCIVLLVCCLHLELTEALLSVSASQSYTKNTFTRIHHHAAGGRNSNIPLHMRMNPESFTGTDLVITEFPRPALRKVVNAPITEFDEALQTTCQEMMVVMYEAQGVGLAAPQVGLNDDIFVYNPSGDKSAPHRERIVCNPVINEYSSTTDVQQEGCLSLRSDYCPGQVARSLWIEVEYQNEKGQQTRRRLKDFEARVFQHEYDHLKGILCWDRFPPEDREAVQANIDHLMGLYTEDDAEPNPNVQQVEIMQPRPLTARYMPPLEGEEAAEKKKTKSKTNTGFGGGGGMGGKKAANKKKKKKK